MHIKKSYKLIAFGNKNHSKILRYTIASGAWLASYLATFRLSLAGITFVHIARKGNMKSALRRVAWFLRKSWMHLNIIEDENFDFTESLTISEVLEVENHLGNQKKFYGSVFYEMDYLYILAFKGHKKAKQEKPIMDIVEEFEATANKILFFVKERHLYTKSLAENEESSFVDKVEIKSTCTKKNEILFVQRAKSILATFANTIPKEDYPWYIISGTFLGLHRENTFLAHDIDVDIGINYEGLDFDDFIAQLRKLPDMSIKNITNIPQIRATREKTVYEEKIGIIKLLHTSGIQIDVFVHHIEGDNIIHGSKIHTWTNRKFGLTMRQLEGVEVYCPDDPERYLTENYGDWRTPVTEFSCSTGTPNLTVSPNFYSVAFFLRRLFWYAQRDNFGKEYQKLMFLLQEQGIIVNDRIVLPFVEV